MSTDKRVEELSDHLKEQLDKYIPKDKWFTADDVIRIRRTDWVLSKLVNAGVLKKEWKGEVIKYRYISK